MREITEITVLRRQKPKNSQATVVTAISTITVNDRNLRDFFDLRLWFSKKNVKP
jgi:hypothetical protein